MGLEAFFDGGEAVRILDMVLQVIAPSGNYMRTIWSDISHVVEGAPSSVALLNKGVEVCHRS